MKRITALFLTVCLLMTLMAGCGQNNDTSNNTNEGAGDSSSNSTDSSGSDDIASPADDLYEMVVEIVNYGYDDPDLQMVEDAVNEITVPEIGVKVSFLTVPISEMATKLGLLVAGNEQVDLVMAGLTTTPSNLASQGLLTDITEYVESSEYLMELADGLLEACMINGRIYAYPAILYPAAAMSFFYDADLAEEYNIQLPDKIESEKDWTDIFDQVVNSDMGVYATSLGTGRSSEGKLGTIFDALGDSTNCAYGIVLDIENGTEIVNWYETEEYENQCRVFREWYEKGYIIPDSISSGYSTPETMTQGMVFGIMSDKSVGVSEAYMSSVTKKNVRSIPVNDPVIKTSDVVSMCWGVSATCERPDKAIAFLELQYQNTELSNLLAYGIEGIHYEVNEGSRIISYPEGIDASTVTYGSFVNEFGNSTQIYHREPLTDDFVASISQYGPQQAKKSKLMGYTFDAESVSAEVAAVTSVISQYAPSLACGVVDPVSQIPVFREELKNAGIEKIIDENQRQLNEWLDQQ